MLLPLDPALDALRSLRSWHGCPLLRTQLLPGVSLGELPKMFPVTLIHSTTFMAPHSPLKMPAS